jgi:hypothetical protein
VSFELKDVITLSIAGVGAALGLLNTWRASDQSRVHLRVAPKIAYPMMPGEPKRPIGCFDIVNLSLFPVWINEFGFTIDGDPRKNKRMVILELFSSDMQPLQRAILEPRRSITVYFEITNIQANFKKAYVRTECGEVAYGTGPALEEFKRVSGV